MPDTDNHSNAEEHAHPVRLQAVMNQDVVRIDMDTTLRKALEICATHRIRHLPVVDESGKLEGLITDRDLKHHISPRIGTISERVSDLDELRRPVHLIMIRKLVTATPETPLSEAARLMLENKVGCIPVVDQSNRLCGIITTGDFLRLVANVDSIPPNDVDKPLPDGQTSSRLSEAG